MTVRDTEVSASRETTDGGIRSTVSRRSALKVGALGVGAAAATTMIAAGTASAGGAGAASTPAAQLGSAGYVQAAPAAGARALQAMDATLVPTSWQVKPFKPAQVDLTTSVFTETRDRLLNLARNYDANKILANFRTTAGLPTQGATPPGSWDDATGNLRGHYSGHFLSMVSYAWAGTGEEVFKTKLDYLVTELGKCQDALAASGLYSHPGFLAAYPETQFVLLESYTVYPTIWAPYYTCHKIMAGLLDCYRLGGNSQALDIVTKMGLWVHSRLSTLPDAQLQQMWGMYIAGEYGGMNEVMAELYAITGNADFLATAKLFDNKNLLNACAADTDILNGKHANQHIPQFLGYLKVFDHTAEEKYHTAVENFWEMVVPHRMFAHGGTGQGELFRARDSIIGTINAATNAETCACYNMLKVSRELFFHSPEAKYMDYYERGLYNQILGSRRNTNSNTDPLVTYMLPVGPGVTRGFGNVGTCCGGTGLENHVKYQDSIYFQSADEGTLYVNLYIPSVLDWVEKDITLTQVSQLPDAGSSTLTVTGAGTFALKLRVPHWVEKGFTVSVNGTVQEITATPGTYLSISRTWATGDTVTIDMPLTLRVEKAIDDPTYQSIFHGPTLMVARSTQTTYREFSFYSKMTLDGGLERSVTPGTTQNFFSTAGLVLAPLYVGTTDRFHMYYKRAEPKIVFGEVDSGVANPKLLNNSTFLDAVWENGPFESKQEFVQAVMDTSDTWVGTGRLSRADRQKVLLAAAKAKL